VLYLKCRNMKVDQLLFESFLKYLIKYKETIYNSVHGTSFATEDSCVNKHHGQPRIEKLQRTDYKPFGYILSFVSLFLFKD